MWEYVKLPGETDDPGGNMTGQFFLYLPLRPGAQAHLPPGGPGPALHSPRWAGRLYGISG